MLSLNEFVDRVSAIFPRLVRGMTRHENNYLTQGVITIPQLWALEFLLKRKECSMKDLADFMRLRLSSVTGLVDRLVKQGLVSRRRTEKDRRVVLVDISPKGKKVVKQISGQRRATLLNVFETLNTHERAAYLHILEKLVQNLA